VLIEFLRDQATSDPPDPAVTDTLQEAAELLRPLRPIVLQKTDEKEDLEKYRQTALSGAKLKNWDLVGKNVHPLYNLVNAERITHNDRARVELAALEYLKHDLDSKYRPSPAAAPDAIAVKFIPAPGEPKLPALKGIKDLKLFDIDLDGRLDLVVLHENKL